MTSPKTRDGVSLTKAILFLLAGPILWAAHFFLIYGAQSAICSLGEQPGGDPLWAVTFFVTGVTLVFLIALAAALLKLHWLAQFLGMAMAEGRDFDFALSLSRMLTVLSLVGVALAGAVALGMDPCAQLR